MMQRIENRKEGGRVRRRKAHRHRHIVTRRRGYAVVAVASAFIASGGLFVTEPFVWTLADANAQRAHLIPEVVNADGGHPLYLPEALPSIPPLFVPVEQVRTPSAGATGIGSEVGIPATVLDAYRKAETTLGQVNPGCHLTWPVLAGIGKIESGHAHRGDVDQHGTLINPIYGPALDGSPGFATITAGNGQWARAAGPMQFIPSTWQNWAVDGSGDGKADVQNVYDSAEAAGRYLCANNRDLNTAAGMRSAILSYNHSESYLNTVSSWIRAYSAGSVVLPDAPGNYIGAVSPAIYTPNSPGTPVVDHPAPTPPRPRPTPTPTPTPPAPAKPAPPEAPPASPTPPAPIAGLPLIAPLDGLVNTVSKTLGGLLK
ncbi:MAG: hypothetical protein QOI21_3146 [Actinomycetota bacterium]|jgi:hypothetical protein|nr:hypothetical protein [Actinomycetota bacterium]